MTVRVALYGGGELASAAAQLGLITVEPARADLAVVDLRDVDALSRASTLAPEVPRVVVLGDDQLALAGALGIPAHSVARSCEAAVLGPLIAATLPPAKRASTRSILVTAARGGAGRSLLVANLARRLASLRGTLCLDLTGHGTLGWWLGATTASWSDLEDLADELTAEHLGVVATEPRPASGSSADLPTPQASHSRSPRFGPRSNSRRSCSSMRRPWPMSGPGGSSIPSIA